MDEYLTVEDFHAKAKHVLPKQAYDYYASGARSETTLKDNELSFQKIKIIPRCLVGRLSRINLSCSFFGCNIDFPIMVAPTAMHKMAHPDGEIGTYRACRKMNTVYCSSSLSTTSVEDIAKEGDDLRWFQLYIAKDKNECKRLIHRVENCGYGALVITVDTPVLGVRLRDKRNAFTLPSGLRLENFHTDDTHLPTHLSESGLERFVRTQIDIDISWNDIEWILKETKLPVLLKGIFNPSDAIKACEMGVSGIVVSNHGARQLDGVPSSINVLKWIVDVVDNRIPVFLDGGVRQGTDVFKALALGAKAVFVGRPILWGLASHGQKGVEKVLEILKDELKETMVLAGCRSLEELDDSFLFNSSQGSKL